MGLTRLKKLFPQLKALNNKAARKHILAVSSADLINCICECCVNVLNGNVKLNKKQRKALTPYGKILRTLAEHRVPVETRRQRILQRGGGFLPALLVPILALVAKLLKNG